MKNHSYLALVFVAAGGCVETRDPIVGTQSLRIDLKSPAGDEMNRLSDTDRTVVIDVTAIGPDGQPDTTYANTVQVYVNFLGTLTPYLGTSGVPTITLAGGKATSQTVMLPAVFGPATLWLDDGTSTNPTYASGASPTLWYRDPFLEDLQRPTNEMALDAYEKSPLELKQVTVDQSKYGAAGRLVVTSVFAQGYTVDDVQCAAGGAPPCTSADYGHAMVFSFSAARDGNGCLIQEGQTIDGFAGGVSEFNGLTEIGFPQSFDSKTNMGCANQDVNEARIPPPVKLDMTWFSTNKINMERNEAGLIEIDGAKVCNLDDDYTTYKQWKIDPAGVGGDCTGNKNLINIISTGVVPTDPATLVGKTLTKVVGTLRPVNIGSFNVWIVYPRSAADLVQ